MDKRLHIRPYSFRNRMLAALFLCALAACLFSAIGSFVVSMVNLSNEMAANEREAAIYLLGLDQKTTLEDKRTGFACGADDYLTKPVDLDELLLHVGALLRRSQAMTSHKLTVGETLLDYDSLTVSRGDLSITLPKKEFYLLFKLLSSPRQIFTRRQLMDEIWGMDAQSDERTVDVHIKRLREKCEVFPDFDIVTVRGLGYKAEKRNG